MSRSSPGAEPWLATSVMRPPSSAVLVQFDVRDNGIPDDADSASALHAAHEPHQVTSASSRTKPRVSLGARHGADPTAQSTSATAPQLRQTRWWWLSATRVS